VVQLLIQRALDTALDRATAESTSQVTAGNDLPSNTIDTQVQSFAGSSAETPWLPNSLQRALVTALDKFGTAACSVISANVKALLSQREVLALIQFLRQQLFQGGHTRSFQSLSVDDEVPRTVRLDTAIKILSSCIDAIGPLGFFGAMDNEDFIGNIIPELVTEITHTKQGLEDASELQGILREAIRYQESIRRRQAAGAHMPNHDAGLASRERSGAIVTVYSEALEGEESLGLGPSLPLSLKIEHVVKPMKIRKGGGQIKQRTIRQKRMLERRMKGQYSFERLVL
jgi:hypothetical protein